MAAGRRGSILYGKERDARIRGRIKAVQKGQVAQREADPVQAPSGEVIASRAGSHVRKVHDHIQSFIPAIEIALIAPHLEAFTRNTLEESRKGGEDIELRARACQG